MNLAMHERRSVQDKKEENKQTNKPFSELELLELYGIKAEI